MSRNILLEKLKRERPAVYIKPDIRNVKVLEFYKAREVFEQTRPAQQKLEKDLKKAMRRYDGRPGCTVV